MDLSNPSDIEAKAKAALALHGGVDILINNGGISVRGAVADTVMDTHRRVMEVNYFGMVNLTRCLLPHMRERGSGRVVQVSSLQGLFALPHRSAYCASKHAVQVRYSDYFY